MQLTDSLNNFNDSQKTENRFNEIKACAWFLVLQLNKIRFLFFESFENNMKQNIS